jgi:enamine deaminase RidA (YjgF/YER057c/UK114 family)
MAPLDLRYLTAAAFETFMKETTPHLLGVIGFGAERPAILAPHVPFDRIDMPSMEDDPVYEVWTADRPATYTRRDVITGMRGDDSLFGCLRLEETPGIAPEALAHEAYTKLFDFVDGEGFAHILRIWNYFPGITEDDHGLERYRRFSLGRHEAFVAKHHRIEQAPAACALGSRTGPLSIYFLATRTAGTPLENPRQVSAYRYPRQYGPRGPTFSRAMLGHPGGQPFLFVSGTASIVGHETMHRGDAAAQTRETLANIGALLAEASAAGFAPRPGEMRLKVYVRHRDDFSVVRNCIAEAFDASGTAIYLQADICRPDLLVEIEAACPMTCR